MTGYITFVGIIGEVLGGEGGVEVENSGGKVVLNCFRIRVGWWGSFDKSR
jgi:hypothetical protein